MQMMPFAHRRAILHLGHLDLKIALELVFILVQDGVNVQHQFLC